MPGLYDDDNDYDDEGPKNLRAALKKAQDEAKAHAAKVAELESANADLAKKVTATTLRNALSDAGIDPKYARFVERDEVEPTAEAVKRWAEDNKDVYAFLNKPASPANEDETDQPHVDQVDADIVAGILAARGAESNGQPSAPSNTETKVTAMKSDQFRTYEDLQKALLEAGVNFSAED